MHIILMCAKIARMTGGVVFNDVEDDPNASEMRSEERPTYDESRGDSFVAGLVVRLRTGDHAALAELYTELYSAVWRLAVRIVQSSAIAEEILQDVFLGVWNRRNTFQHTDDLRAYVYKSVRNRAINHVQHDRVVATTQAAIQGKTLDTQIIGRIGPAPDETVTRDEFYQAYHRTLAALNERERTALQLRWEEELPLDQIAHILGMSIEGVRRLILRVQKKLQTILADYRS